MPTDPNKVAIVNELLKRRDKLSPEKQALLDEAKRRYIDASTVDTAVPVEQQNSHSPREFANNLMQSGVNYAKDTLSGLTLPIQVGIASSTEAGRERLAENRPHMEDVVQAYKEKYSNPAEAFFQDPVGVAGDVSALLGLGSGALKLGARVAPELGGAAKLAGGAAEVTNPLNLFSPANSPVASIAKKVAPGKTNQLAEWLYRKALKTPTTADAKAVKSAIRGALEEKVPVTGKGVAANQALIDMFDSQIGEAIDSAAMQGRKATPYNALERVFKTLKDESVHANPRARRATVQQTWDEFVKEHVTPTIKTENLTPQVLAENTPPPKEGTIRLYRGEHPTKHDSGIWEPVGDSPEKAGGWFTSNKDYADYFRASQPEGAQLVFVDVPEGMAKNYVVKKNPKLTDSIEATTPGLAEQTYFFPERERIGDPLFKNGQSSFGEPEIPLKHAYDVKRKTGQNLPWGQVGTPEEETLKAIYLGLGDDLKAATPELADLNRKQSQQINLRDFLTRATNRNDNKALFGFLPAIYMDAVSNVTGVKQAGVAAALAKWLADRQMSKIAVGLANGPETSGTKRILNLLSRAEDARKRKQK